MDEFINARELMLAISFIDLATDIHLDQSSILRKQWSPLR
jgi:hypothetical protein